MLNRTDRYPVWQYNIIGDDLSGMETLTLILGVWEKYPGITIELTTHAGDGKKLLQRIRTKLSNVRKSMKALGEPSTRFTINAWHKSMVNMGHGRVDVLTLTQKTTIGHKIREEFESYPKIKSLNPALLRKEEQKSGAFVIGIDGKRKYKK